MNPEDKPERDIKGEKREEGIHIVTACLSQDMEKVLRIFFFPPLAPVTDLVIGYLDFCSIT